MALPSKLSMSDIMVLNFSKAENTFAPGELDSPRTTPSETSPTNSSFSSAGHRLTSSQSSCSSSPSLGEPAETFYAQRNKASGLSDVVEEPTEIEGSHSRVSHDWVRWSQDVPSMRSSFGLPSPSNFDNFDGYFASSEPKAERRPKRQRSADFGNLANKFVSRFPSISRRSRANRSASLPVSESSSAAPSPKIGRSRSNSRTRSLFKRPGTGDAEAVETEQQAPGLIETITEDDDQDVHMPDTDLHDQTNQLKAEKEPVQRASTPLLPVVSSESEVIENRASALPSPKIVSEDASTMSKTSSPTDANRSSAFSSPSVLQRPSDTITSIASIESPPRMEDSPILMSSEGDEWSQKLGHADFQISPEPYLPSSFDRQSCDALLSAWERARVEFSKHLARTTTHFGQSSTTYQLSEEKWAEIDDKWRAFYKRTVAEASRLGEVEHCAIVQEPPPVAKIPSLSEPHSEGKFPKLGDSDIVGPMQVECPIQVERRASKKTQFLKMLDGIFSPTVRHNRSVTG